MAAVTRGLLASPLSRRYRLDAVATYRSAAPVRRVVVYCLALLRLVAWSVLCRGRIVHVHATVRGSMYRKSVCVLLARMLRRRVVLHIHSGPGDIADFRAAVGRPSRALFVAALRASNALLAVSSSSAAALERAYGVDGVLVIPNAAPPVVTRKPHLRSDGLPTALYVGGFANPAKGGDMLLEALEQLRTESLHIVLAGPGEIPEAGRALIERNPTVRWVGWLDRHAKEAALADADVFVLASRSEGLPVALLEAMAHGLAIVATTVGGVPDVLDADRDALLVPPAAPDELAGALARIAGDGRLRERLGAAARERARCLSADEVADRLDALYATLL